MVNKRMYYMSIFALALVVVLGVQVAFRLGGEVYIAFAATTVSSNVLNTPSIRIDATNPDFTSTSGVIDLDVDAAAANVAGQITTVTAQGNYSVYGSKIEMASAADLTGSSAQIGQSISLTPRATSTGGTMIGQLILNASSSTTGSSGSGILVTMDADGGMGGQSLNGSGQAVGVEINIQKDVGNGSVKGFTGSATKTSAGGTVAGIDLVVSSTTAAADYLYGVSLELNASGNPTTSAGVYVNESGASGTIQDGVKVASGNNTGAAPYGFTDGLDVSDTDIQYAINLGMNPILTSGSFSIQMDKADFTVLTIENPNVSYLGGLFVEGSVKIGNNTNVNALVATPIAKHYSTTSAIDNTNLAATSCESFTVAATGVASGDTILATPGVGGGTALVNKNIVWSAFATTNTVNLRVCNPTSSALGEDPSVVTWRFDVWQH